MIKTHFSVKFRKILIDRNGDQFCPVYQLNDDQNCLIFKHNVIYYSVVQNYPTYSKVAYDGKSKINSWAKLHSKI